jgi:ATP-dependent Lhr-like helicase
VLRHARGNGPFTIGDLRQRLGVDPRLALDELAAEGALIEGAFRPGGSEREWIEPDVLRRVRRRTLAHLRRAVEPVEREALARFLPGWHGIGRDIGSGDARLREVISQLGGVAMPVATWEQDVLPLRVPGYRPPLLDAACASGEVVWIGAGEGRVALYLRDDVPLLQPAVDDSSPPSEVGARVASALESQGALFFRQLVDLVGEPDRVVLSALWELAWAGTITNDAWHPLRSGGRIALRPVPPPSLRRRARPTATMPAALGRWSVVAPLLEPAPSQRDRARALAEALLDRHGIVTRAAVLSEGVAGGFSAVYGELRLMEEAGLCQRGYFVEGLGGAQFALPAAVERLRDVREPAARGGATAVLSAVDPASPYGAAVPWPETASRKLARAAGAWVVLVAGRLALYVERGGRGLVLVDPDLLEPGIEALATLVSEGRVKRLAIERVDGEPVAGTEAERLLVAHGFLQAPRRVVLRA